MVKRFMAVLVICTASSVGMAAESTSYTYDALGRLVAVAHQEGATDGVSAAYNYDAAGNRTNVTVQGAQAKVVVVPLNGFTVIPLTAD